MAQAVGELLAARNIRVVYGGASVGMMGALADAAMARGGEVFGVIPHSLDKRELTHRGLSELRMVESMHERKEVMFAASDAFVALPGGYGTLDELFEALTERQIGLHEKRTVLVEREGFWNGLQQWIARAVQEQFVPEHVARALEVVEGLEGLEGWLDGFVSAGQAR